MSGFFEPPPSPWPEQAEPVNPPPWTGRPQGPPPGAVVSELLLARSEQAAVCVDYVDAYPEGFELEIRASTRVAYHELGREGDGSGPDVFGRHSPIVGERRDVLSPQLLRIGVEFLSTAAPRRTSAGHDRPVGGPACGPCEVVGAAVEGRAASTRGTGSHRCHRRVRSASSVSGRPSRSPSRARRSTLN